MTKKNYHDGIIERYDLDSHTIIPEILSNYREHLDRISTQDQNTRLPGSIGAFKGMLSSGYSLYKSVKGLKTKKAQAETSLDITINNFTANSLVLYKIDKFIISSKDYKKNKVVLAENTTLSADDSTNISIKDIDFKADNGPRFHFCMDDGKNSVFFIVRFGYRNKYNTDMNYSQIRIRDVTVHDSSYPDMEGSVSNGLTTYDLLGQTWRFNHFTFKKPFFIQAPSISSVNGSISLNFI